MYRIIHLLFRALLACIMWNLASSETSISQECLPCNSTISWASPRIGFLCNEGFPSTPLQAPYTCKYTLEHGVKNYTLQLFLHELHFRENTLEISTCNQRLMHLMRMQSLGRPVKLSRDKFCSIAHPLENVKQTAEWPPDVLSSQILILREPDYIYTSYVMQPSVLNFTIIKPDDFHLRLPTDHYGKRYGYNITYEIKAIETEPNDSKSPENLVDHAYRSHLSHCNLNGIPVLKPDPAYRSYYNGTHYKFMCECLARGTWGDMCQYDDTCTLETERSLCSNHGKCRIRGSMLTCQCDAKSGFFGTYCEYPYTAQPPDYDNKEAHCSDKCEGKNSHCHVLTMHNKNETRCSCRAGYQLSGDNKTSCLEIHKYDVVVNIPLQEIKNENYDRMVKQIINRWNATVDNLSTAPHPDRGIVQVKFSTDQGNYSLLNTSHLWVDGSSNVKFSATPHLSLGPMEAFLEEGSQKLKCEAYGGDDMVFTWLKDDIKIFTTNVHKCKAVENIETSRLKMKAGEGRKANLAKETCVMYLEIRNWTDGDQGKYTCKVSDRHHIQESHLIMNCSSKLHIVMTPPLATVYYGSDLQINCRTSKFWDSQEQYNIEWTLIPPNHSSSHISETIVYHSSDITIRNITGDTEVECTVSETEIVRNWCPGKGSKTDSGKSSIHIRVLKPEQSSKKIYCPREIAYGINWQETHINKYDQQLCPVGFSGVCSRACDDKIHWKIPDCSKCTFNQLSKVFHTLNLQHSLGLHGPKASLVDIDAQNLTKQILETMENRPEPLLPGESTYILQLLRNITNANQNKLNKVTPEMFFSVINLVVVQEKMFNTRKVEDITKLIQDYLVTVGIPENNVTNVTLPSLSVSAQHLHSNEKFQFNTSTQSSSWWVAAQVESPSERLLTQAVTFLDPQLLFSHGSLSSDGSYVISNLSAPIVHLLEVTEDAGSTPYIQEKIEEAETPLWTLHYPCNSLEGLLNDNTSQHSWRWQCGRANFSYQTARWDLSVCRSVHQLHGGSCSCSCSGQGLYGFLQVYFDPPPFPSHEKKEMLGVCLSISCGILILCGALLLPRCHIQAVQLRLLKCLTLATFNAAFVLHAFYPIPKPDYVWVLILCIWCQILSLGIGVAQMMAIFINLSNMSHQSGSNSELNITPMADMLQNLPVSPTTIILIIAFFMATMCSGIVYLICLVTGYQLTRPFLPVEDAPGLTGAVVGFMITISVLWGYLCVSNLTLMSIKSSTQQRSSTAHVVRRLVSLMVGDWIFIIMSLFEDFNVALNSLFSITAIALSIMVIWIYFFTADDTACCFGNHYKETNKGGVSCSGVAGEVVCGSSTSGGDDVPSCMSGLIACHSSTNRSSYVGTESTSDDYRTRGDSMLSQISSAAMTEYHEANPSYGGPRSKFFSTHRNPKDVLPQHPTPYLQMYSLSEEQSTNNILLRGGIDLVCGEDDSNIAKLSRKRTISFTHHQPIIHKNSSGKTYLDMEGNEKKEISGMTQNSHFIEPPVSFNNCARRSYVNVPTSNSSQSSGKLLKNISNEKSYLKPQINCKKGYIPMTTKDKNDFINDQKGLNGGTTHVSCNEFDVEMNKNVSCNEFTVELSKNSESDVESLREEIINASIPICELEVEDKCNRHPYVKVLTPRKENGDVINGNEQIIIVHKNNVQSQDYVNSQKQLTKIYVHTNDSDHMCNSVITTKDYVNHKSLPLEMTPPVSLSPNDTIDSSAGDASSDVSINSSPRITREHNAKLSNKMNSSDGNKT